MGIKIYDLLADPLCGLLEIKCPFSKRAETLEQASTDPTFYLEKIGDKFYLKRGHSSGYYEPCCGLLEVKCPFSKRAETLEQASADPTFYLEKIGDKFYLKRGHSSGYYKQVQGQLAITGMKWCDLFVFLSETNEMYVDTIPFDNIYWSTQLLPKLREF